MAGTGWSSTKGALLESKEPVPGKPLPGDGAELSDEDVDEIEVFIVQAVGVERGERGLKLEILELRQASGSGEVC